MYFLWNIRTRESQNWRTIDCPHIQRTLKNRVWLLTPHSTTQNSNLMSQSIVQMLLELQQLGAVTPVPWGPVPCPPHSGEEPFPNPHLTRPDTAPRSSLRSCFCHQRSVPAPPGGVLPLISLPLILAQHSPGCLCPCGQWFCSHPGVLPALPPQVSLAHGPSGPHHPYTIRPCWSDGLSKWGASQAHLELWQPSHQCGPSAWHKQARDLLRGLE